MPAHWPSFLDSCTGLFTLCFASRQNDKNVSIYWHDRLDVPLTKYHIGRLKTGQKINRFLTMQYQARKNPLAKKLNRSCSSHRLRHL